MDEPLLDAIAAQVRAFPPLPLDEVGRLLESARKRPGGAEHTRLVEHHLSVALTAALDGEGVCSEVGDLHQEASIAVVVAVAEYAQRGGDPAGLRRYVERVVRSHLARVRHGDEERRRTDQRVVEDVESLEAAIFGLRRRLGRAPSTSEIAADLEWDGSRVEVIGELLTRARAVDDAELLPYLDPG